MSGASGRDGTSLADRLGYDEVRHRGGAGNRAYSRFVGFMRYALPAVAAILLGLVAIWPLLSGEESGFRVSLTDGTAVDAMPRMIAPRYEGTDHKNRPFTITAAESSQPEGDTSIVHLKTVAADMLTGDERTGRFSLTSDQGLYRRDAETLQLEGRVRAHSDSGHEFRTDAAHVDLSAGTAQGDAPVTGTGPQGMLRAGGFRFADRGRTMTFKDGVHLILLPGTVQTRPADDRRG